MTTISQILNEQEDKISVLFDKLGVFFAFSNEQFEKGKKDGVTYVKCSQSK